MGRAGGGQAQGGADLAPSCPQLVMTVGLLAVVVYLYTVVAFNFFRKFYNKSEDEDEPDMKCDDMMTVSPSPSTLGPFLLASVEGVNNGTSRPGVVPPACDPSASGGRGGTIT